METQNARKNTNFDGWEKHMGRKSYRKNTDEKHTDEKSQNLMVGKKTLAENHTEKTWMKNTLTKKTQTSMVET